LPEQQQEVSLEQSLNKLLQMAIKRRWWIIIPASTVALVACMVSMLLPSRYESTATIFVKSQQVPEHFVTPNTTIDAREALLSMTDAIISEAQLVRIINEYSLYPEQRKTLTPEQLVGVMRHNIKIEPLKKLGEPDDPNTFTISFAGPDPHKAQEVATRLTNLFIEESDKSREKQSEGTTNFFSGELDAAAADLKKQEARVREFKVQYLGELPEQQEGNLAVLSSLHTELQNTTATLARAREQQVYLQSLLAQYESMTPNEVVSPGSTGVNPQDTIRAELTRLRNERSDLLARYTPEYPDVVKINEQIKETEALLAASASAPKATKDDGDTSKPAVPAENNAATAQVRSQLEANRLEIQNASEDVKQIQARIADYQSRLNLTPVREEQLAELLRDYNQSKLRYDDLESKKSQSELATSLVIRQQGQRFNIIDPPSLPTKPSNSEQLKISLGGLLLGIAVGAALAFLVDTRDHSIRDEQELRSVFSFPLLLGVPMLLSKADERRRSQREVLEWLVGTVLCLLICATEFYVIHRG
jgi:polysaccharide chain length determinant protein (PEP-CTERM system associated)